MRNSIWQAAFLAWILLPCGGLALPQAPHNATPVRSLSEVVRVFAPIPADRRIALNDSFIVAYSDSLVWQGRHLQRGRDYRIRYYPAEILLQLPANGAQDTLYVYYQRLPLAMPALFVRRVRAYADKDTTRNPGTPVLTRRLRDRQQEESETFGTNLRKSGSLVRGLSLGTNQGLKVDSGLRLQISGNITESVEVVAALTDQNLPIQPEGNTQTLQEIDKVFIEMKGPQFSVTLGDYQLGFSGTEFARYQRKLQGATATVRRGPTQITLFGAVSRGKFRTQEFRGVEGKQGPYQLTGDRGQIDIIVLAGTERVWVDGELMVRGENNDYVIEYANGQITFTRNRLITADSRITVDFQYSDQHFQRNLFGAEASIQALDNRLQLRTTLIREGDDRDNPLSISLNDTTLAALSQAGDGQATLDGARFVGAGKGAYVLRDSIFVYVGPDSGDYQVRFSDMGEGNGRYRFAGFGRFEYVGPGRGRYEPVILLPRAQQNDMADLRLEYRPAAGVSLVSEIALSRFDQNLYSASQDDDNQGNAYLMELQVAPQRWSVGGKSLGKPEIRLRYRRRTPRFQDLDRINVVEYGRRWDIGSDRPQFGETVMETTFGYEPWRSVRFYSSVGWLNGGQADIRSRRWEAGTLWQRPDRIELDYRIEHIRRSKAGLLGPSSWLRQKGAIARQLGKLRPFLALESEDKKETLSDSLEWGFRFTEWTAGLALQNWNRISSELKYSVRDDDSLRAAIAFPTSSARTLSYRIALQNWNNLVAEAGYIHRERDYTTPQRQDTRTDLAEIKLGYQAWQRSLQADAQYQITNTQVNRLQRVYLRVREGEGNYRFDPDLNEYVQDPFGDFILRFVPTDEFIPVVDLRSRLQVRWHPEFALRSKKELSPIQKALKVLSTETVIRVEEKTRNPRVRDIYLFRLSAFQDPRFSLFGTQSIRQDVHVFGNRRSFSMRYRLFASKSLNNQFLEGEQRDRLLRHELRLNMALTQKLANQLEVIRTLQDRTFKIAGRQDRFIRSVRLQNDVSYRPNTRLELATRLVLGFDRDRAFEPATRVRQLSVKPRLTYSFQGRGRLRAELEVTRVSASPADRVLPYELAQGNRVGTTVRWDVAFDYRLADNLNMSFSYQGRDEPQRLRTLHLARVEMRAFF